MVIHYTGSACWTVLIPTRHPQHNKAASKLIRLECPICCYCMFDQTFFYRSQTKLGEGNVLRGVCLSTGGRREGGVPWKGVPWTGFQGGGAMGGVLWRDCCEGLPPPPLLVNKRAIRILLECFFKNYFWTPVAACKVTKNFSPWRNHLDNRYVHENLHSNIKPL